VTRPSFSDLIPGAVVEGTLLPEAVEVLAVVPMGRSVKLIGKGLRTGQVVEPVSSAEQVAGLRISPREQAFDGEPRHFKLGVEAARLALAYEYDPYFQWQQAMRQHSAPFYLRRLKEALVGFPDPETGAVRKLFTNRDVRTAKFELDGEEFDFYDALTRYVEDQSILAASSDNVQANILSFQMAMLQRRFASSLYAVRRSLERMREKRKRILEDPQKYRQEQITRRLPEDFDELPEDEQSKILEDAEQTVLRVDPITLREEIHQLGKLVEQARELESREVESKLQRRNGPIRKIPKYGSKLASLRSKVGPQAVRSL
jgi:hypothetical protein